MVIINLVRFFFLTNVLSIGILHLSKCLVTCTVAAALCDLFNEIPVDAHGQMSCNLFAQTDLNYLISVFVEQIDFLC